MLKLRLGKIDLRSRVLLAPMAGVTDLPFRKIVRNFGDFMMYSEMIASYAVIRETKRTRKMMNIMCDEFTSIQLVGADPNVMSEAAKIACDLGARFLDINMGCPVKKIVKSEAGSALMQNEKLAAEIIKKVTKSVSIPVTLKMRLGWNADNMNAPTIAKIAQDFGISMITVHARTRSQLYSGSADWRDVYDVKLAVNDTPVIVNGDIIDTISAQKALQESGADGIMIGRGALGRPWILKTIHDALEGGNTQECHITQEVMYDVAKRHVMYIFEFYCQEIAVKLLRKVLMYYCKGNKNATRLRQDIVSITSPSEIYEALHKIFL